MVYCLINSALQGCCWPVLIETLCSCIFRFGFTFPGCGYFLIPGRLTFVRGRLIYWAGRMPLLPSWAGVMGRYRDILPLSSSLSEQGLSMVIKGSGWRRGQEKRHAESQSVFRGSSTRASPGITAVANHVR